MCTHAHQSKDCGVHTVLRKRAKSSKTEPKVVKPDAHWLSDEQIHFGNVSKINQLQSNIMTWVKFEKETLRHRLQIQMKTSVTLCNIQR
jgi:hypothetical protein